MESKLGNSSRKRKRLSDDRGSNFISEVDSTSTSSESEDEDDAGELATEAVDAEIQNTLNAIRSKDPRVYNKDIRFYNEEPGAVNKDRHAQRKASEMHLRDYHREALLSNFDDGNEDKTDAEPLPYTHEQEALRKSIVGEINAAVTKDPESEDGDDDEAESAHAFLSRKEKAQKPKRIPPADLDVENADKDPETFLSNFMASRAWVPTAASQFQPFESDDEEQDRQAEEFEEAYNFRFEDPEKANEKLVSYARDTNQRYSVRRMDDNPRKRRRELEKQQKDIRKQEIAEEKARLKKLKVEELEEKVRRIRRSAGLKTSDITDKDWDKFLNGDWNDEQWETEMQKRFGDEYYANDDFPSAEEENELSNGTKKRKPRKPEWDKDIEIDDLVPDFSAGENADFSLSETDAHTNRQSSSQTSARQSRLQQDRARKEEKKQSRKDRRKVEQLVDEQLNFEPTLLSRPSKKAGLFRYRDTSPTSFGLSAREILLAEDAHLNEYAGLKKLAAFRDPDKKRKDQKHFGKKARLRRWRKDTFGDENGPREEQDGAEVPSNIPDVPNVGDAALEKRGKRRRKISKRIKPSLATA